MKCFDEGGALYHMTGCKQFCCWKIENEIKLPTNADTGAVCDAHDPANWCTANEAMEGARNNNQGVAFVFTENDPFFFLDIDKAYTDGQWSARATELCQRFEGCAVEVSQSGKGLHIFGRAGRMPHRKKNVKERLELYTELRFVALTNNDIAGDCNFDASEAFTATVNEFFAPGDAASTIVGLTDSPDPEWIGTDDDDELIKRAMKSRSKRAIFGGTASFKDVWNANAKVLGEVWPDDEGDQGREYDASHADASLMQHLAFWTGKHGTRMIKLAEKSKLKRSKWDTHPSYLDRSAMYAISVQKDVYKDPRQKKALATAPVDAASDQFINEFVIETSPQFLSIPAMIEMFKGCVYVVELNKVMMANGTLLDQASFNGLFSNYIFNMDCNADKTSTKAWDAFVYSRAVKKPTAWTVCFRPDLQPGEFTMEGDLSHVNTYFPVNIKMIEGDVTPFLTHLKKLLPVGDDAIQYLSYIASIVQNPGVKFQYASLLQGCEGNGKTFFTSCLMYALGEKFCHMVDAADLENKFNGWLLNKILYVCEDVFVSEHRGEVMEKLKPMITATTGIGIQRKGENQITARIVGNWLFNSNHRNAIRKTVNDRRWMVHFCAQQSAEDLKRDGMDGNYFPELYKWARDAEGYAKVAYFLKHYEIPAQYDPARGCHRAPVTSSTNAAVAESMGMIEQEVENAIEEGAQGFRGGWISSLFLNRLLETKGLARRMPLKRRCEMLENMGYVKHPALKKGRANSFIAIDAGKPRIYVQKDSELAKITKAKDVEDQYAAAQVQSLLPETQ